MFLTMCTAGSFMRFMELQAHDYMAFMESCAYAIVQLNDLTDDGGRPTDPKVRVVDL
jgi:hypothetical protein